VGQFLAARTRRGGLGPQDLGQRESPNAQKMAAGNAIAVPLFSAKNTEQGVTPCDKKEILGTAQFYRTGGITHKWDVPAATRNLISLSADRSNAL